MCSTIKRAWMERGLSWALIILGMVIGLAAQPGRARPGSGLPLGDAISPQAQQSNPQAPDKIQSVEPEPPSPLSKKQQRELLKDNFEKMKRDADNLAALAKSLQEQIHSSNENVFSLRIVEQAEKIEKLAKKIKNNARNY